MICKSIPDAGVAAPLTLLTADLPKLPVIGIAAKNDASTLLIPTAMSSCEASTLYLFLIASVLATAMLSINITNGTRANPELKDKMTSPGSIVLFADSRTDLRGTYKREPGFFNS